MSNDPEQPPHRWDSQFGELLVSGRTVGYVYVRASVSGFEWSPSRWWRVSKARDAWVETEEWFIRPDGAVESYAGDNVGPEAQFAQLDAGKYTVALARLDPTTVPDASGRTETDVDLRWVSGDGRDQLLARLRKG
ncbi:hypothetical protein SAMN04487846_3436 [Microbacterium sp. cf046]|uniref:hypothetical protein n=1 Tax=Microbacterium sp. cf046 TaxID=1761803 RepID=UPI0008DFF784|nr:hypothetical protein [Microbacterium sp. cf046]SFS17052.1 hypothetical protein SAMN04487846_3436 [Microbacterium sp. cf046]